MFSPKQDDDTPRLELAAREPEKGFLDIRFFRFIEEAGMPMDSTAALLIVVGAGLVCMAAPLLLTDSLIGAAIGLVLGIIVALTAINLYRQYRVSRMRKHLPEALQIVADAVRAGHTLEEAFDLVQGEMKGPLQTEFYHAYSQLRLGHAPVSIMNRMIRRVPLPEFRVFGTAVMVHQRAGGNLSLLTERMAHAARERQEVRGHMMAVTAGSRLSAFGMVIGSILAMIVLAALEPDYVGAFVTHRLGPVLLTIAVVLQLLGVIWVWRALKENY